MTRIGDWGPACWIFIHTLLSKIKPSEFENVRNSLLNNLIAICTHLPCEVCSNHSKVFFQRQGPLNFKTKEEMIHFFWFFHQYVNRTKKKPDFPLSDMAQYNSKNLRETYVTFARHYTAKDNGLKLMSETMQRKGIFRGFHSWIRMNGKKFVN